MRKCNNVMDASSSFKQFAFHSPNVFPPSFQFFYSFVQVFAFKSGADTLMRPLVLSDTAVIFLTFSFGGERVSRCALAHSTGLQLLRSIHVASKHYTHQLLFFFYLDLQSLKMAGLFIFFNIKNEHVRHIHPEMPPSSLPFPFPASLHAFVMSDKPLIRCSGSSGSWKKPR